MVDISDLHTTVDFFLNSSFAASTTAAYKSAQQRYLAFCVRFGVAHPFPLIEPTLCSYVAFLAREGLKHKTIKHTYPASSDLGRPG